MNDDTPARALDARGARRLRQVLSELFDGVYASRYGRGRSLGATQYGQIQNAKCKSPAMLPPRAVCTLHVAYVGARRAVPLPHLVQRLERIVEAGRFDFRRAGLVGAAGDDVHTG